MEVDGNVTRFHPGDAVFTSSADRLAEFACAAEIKCAETRATISLEQAAAGHRQDVPAERNPWGFRYLEEEHARGRVIVSIGG